VKEQVQASSFRSGGRAIALIVVWLAVGGLTIAALRRGLGPVRAGRLVPVAQRIVVRRS
jgi:hypothetical protein